MEANRKRTIRDGSEFDHLFPPPGGTERSVKQTADVEDTLNLIRRTVPQTLWHTRRIAAKLKGRNLDETCYNIWHFVYGHIQYKRDKEGVEQIRSPRRTWWERKRGVDCDCYTEFISSILMNLKIPHKARITKYPKKPPEVPRWQHIYPVVPRSGRIEEDLTDRDDYIVLDCVKDNYDDEQEFLERKDYDMRLDYLDGIDQDEEQTDIEEMIPEYEVPELADFNDLASLYDDEQLEMGNIFKKIGKGIKKVAKKVGDAVGKGIRVINRFVNPATILLRNGFLLAMKMNMKNVAGRLRYAYLTDAQAKALSINPEALKKIRAVMHRAETIYWQAGGKKENLKKAILGGKGNKDKKVPLSGLFGIDDEYMDMDEYNIIHMDVEDLTGLGELVSGTAIATASGAVAALSTALKQIKGIFGKGSKEEAAFQSESEDAGSGIVNLPAAIQNIQSKIAPVTRSLTTAIQTFTPPPSLPPASTSTPPSAASRSFTVQPPQGETQAEDPAEPDREEPALPETTIKQNLTTTNGKATLPSPVTEDKGIVQKAASWVKENPGKTILITGAVVGGTYLLVKTMSGKKQSQGKGLSGLPKQRKRGKRKKNKTRNKVQRLKLL